MTAPQPPKTYGDQHKTAADIQAMPDAERHAYLDQYMSPADRTAYLQDQAAQVGQNDHSFLGLHGMMERLKAEAAANKTAQTIGQGNVQQASSGDVQYVTGLQPSSTDYQGIAHDELKNYVNTNLDAAQVGELSDAYHQMSSIFNQFATTLGSAVGKSQGEWEGPAADSARSYFTSLQKWADANSQNSTLASEVVYQQSSAASTAKNSMPEPIPFNWSDEVKSWASSNPFNIVDSVQNSIQKAEDSQAAHDQAAQVMSTYDQGLYAAASKQPVFAEPPKFEAGSAATSSQQAESIGSVGSGVASVGGTGGAGGHAGGAGGGSGSMSGSLAGLTGAPSLAAGAKTGGAYNSGTRPQSYQPSNSSFNPATSGSGANNMNALGGMPMGPMGGFGPGGGDAAYSSKIGRGGGFGPGGSGSAVGSGSGSASGGTGPGAQTGARPGGAGAAESAAGGGRGAAGSSGRSGMSGMGGHGGKGQGGEDEEHQRPSWLVEPDPDDIFGTTERTAPPVIGE